MEIVKLKDYNNEGGSPLKDVLKELAAKELRPLTREEWLSISDADFRKHDLFRYTPVLLKEPNGLLSRGYGVDCFFVNRHLGDYGRYGVVGTPIQKGKHKHVWKCECGATRKV